MDDEAAVAEMAEFDAHVGQCANCRTLQERRLALREVLARELPQFEAPSLCAASWSEAAHRGSERK